MIDGKYAITVNTPIGQKNGTLILSSSEEQLSGLVEVMGQNVKFANGKLAGNTYEVTGELKTLMGKIPYSVRGTVEGDNLSAIAETKHGKMEISGIRIKSGFMLNSGDVHDIQ